MNLYQQFQALIPKSTQIIAIVQAEFPDGTTSCNTLDGQLIRVKGVGGRSTGQNVFVVIDPNLGNYILGTAPQLPSYLVNI